MALLFVGGEHFCTGVDVFPKGAFLRQDLTLRSFFKRLRIVVVSVEVAYLGG